jgi:hypothetical protein
LSMFQADFIFCKRSRDQGNIYLFEQEIKKS